MTMMIWLLWITLFKVDMIRIDRVIKLIYMLIIKKKGRACVIQLCLIEEKHFPTDQAMIYCFHHCFEVEPFHYISLQQGQHRNLVVATIYKPERNPPKLQSKWSVSLVKCCLFVSSFLVSIITIFPFFGDYLFFIKFFNLCLLGLANADNYHAAFMYS